MINTKDEGGLNRELEGRIGAQREERSESFRRTALWVLVSGACYYLATQIAWALCFPDSKVSLFFPPHAVLVSVLLLVPTRHWWAYTLSAIGGHFLATQQAQWPLLYALHCEVFDAVQNVSAAAGIRIFIKSPLKSITLRDAIAFVLIAVVIVPYGTAFWGAAFTISNHFGTDYWVEWRNLGISNAVTAVVLVPAILLGIQYLSARRKKVTPARMLEALLLGVGILIVGVFAFGHQHAGPGTSPALLYAPIPLLIWAALRFGLGGTSAGVLIITFLAIWGTMHGRGPFLLQAPAENAFALQMFLLVTATPLMFLAVVIEEEKRSKHALHESTERMGLAADAAHLGMWVWDVSGDDAWMTEQGRDLFGMKPDAHFDYAAILDRVHPEDRAAREAAIKRALETQGEYELEYRMQLPDGGVRWISARGRCVATGDGERAKLVGVSMDVTARKQAELEAAQQRAELGHLTRVSLLGELAASLAHELNQPLTAILSNAQAARRFIAEGGIEPDELRAILDDIVRDDKRAGAVIHHLRAMVSKRPAVRETCCLNELVREVLELMRSEMIEAKIEVRAVLAPEPPWVLAARVELLQVMVNLLVNAVHAMEATPPERRIIEVETRAEADVVVVTIRDRGHGLPPERLPAIFDSFFTTKTTGLGMGLSICRRIIESHAGRIEARNHDDGGAVFSISLPVAAV